MRGGDGNGHIGVHTHSFCFLRVYGLKPTPGTILTAGLVPFSARFDAIGPITRSMDDMAILTNVLCSPDLATAMRRSHFSALANHGGTSVDGEIAERLALIQADLPDRQGEIVVRPDCVAVRKATYILAMRDLIPTLVDLGEERCARVSEEVTRTRPNAMSRRSCAAAKLSGRDVSPAGVT